VLKISALCTILTVQIALSYPVTPLKKLEQQAKARVNGKPRVELADLPSSTAETPNYLRALGSLPETVQPLTRLVDAALFSGALGPEVKMAMGVRVSQLLDAPYVATHMTRALRATERGRVLLKALEANEFDSLPPSDRLALDYSEWLTQDVHGVSDADFRRVRTYYNDAQIVELTTTTCFFNYFTRLTEALQLPVESWALREAASGTQGRNVTPIARVALISDAEMDGIDQARSARQAQAVKNILGIGFANSMRAMYLAPEMALAWSQYGTATRSYDAVSREIKLQVSFAVSMANGCRYCTLHQVLGLKRLGVNPAKLMQMRKDDSALTAEELAAVTFARKLTSEPWSASDADYQALESKFGKQGALEIVLQTCAFAYMNHFTDGLRLPSEDQAVQTYREVYGGDWTAPAAAKN
jgi:AhpD family alkylhydroperoxidase